MTGHWLYYSYTEEGFKYWNEPKIAAVLFDVQNGLFLYSPLVLLMMAGLGCEGSGGRSCAKEVHGHA